jgi:hypothetical protein
MQNAVRPIQVIADCENYVPGFFVDAYNINNVKLLNRHFACYPFRFLIIFGQVGLPQLSSVESSCLLDNRAFPYPPQLLLSVQAQDGPLLALWSKEP